MIDCETCYETIKESYSLKCDKCNYIYCKKCLISWNKLDCINCQERISDLNFKNLFTLNEIKNIYIPIYVYKHLSQIESKILSNYLYKNEVKRLLKFSNYINEFDTKEEIKKCIKEDCQGYFDKNNVCSSCSLILCRRCNMEKKKYHVCKDEDIESYLFLRNRSNGTNCPFCNVFIIKSYGCDHMLCSNCGQTFSYNKGYKINISNGHYNDFINKELVEKREKSKDDDIQKIKEMEQKREEERKEKELLNKDKLSEDFNIFSKIFRNRFKMVNYIIPANIKYFFESIEKEAKKIALKNYENQCEYINYIRNINQDNLNFENNIEYKKNIIKLYNCMKKLDYYHQILNCEIYNIQYIEDYLNKLIKNNILSNNFVYIVKDGNIIKKNNTEKKIHNSFTNSSDLYNFPDLSVPIKNIKKNSDSKQTNKPVIEEITDFNLCLDFKNLSLDTKVEEKQKYTGTIPKVLTNKIVCRENNKKQKPKQLKIINKPLIRKNEPIKMLDKDQENHLENILMLLKQFHTVLNCSYAGSGKTYISLHSAHLLEIKKLFIICPNIVKDKWHNILEEYNDYYNFEYIIVTQNNIALTKHQISHDYLKKDINDRGILKVLEPTDLLNNYCDKNTMLIIDEAHIGRNNGAISTAISRIASLIRERNGYINAISATPVENILQVKILIDKLNILNGSEINTLLQLYENNLYKILEVVESMSVTKKDNSTISNLLKKSNFGKHRVNTSSYCNKTILEYNKIIETYKMLKNIKITIEDKKEKFSDDIIKKFISEIYNDTKSNLTYKLILHKISYSAPNKDRLKFYESNYDLASEKELIIDNAFEKTHISEIVDLNTLALIKKALLQIENAYLDGIEKMVNTVYNNVPKCKIAISLNYIEPIQTLYSSLKKTIKNINIITGDTKDKNHLIDLFQKDTDDLRILIISQASLNVGVDLDDKTGAYKRFVIINPNFNYTNIYQFMHRFFRINSKTKPIVHLLANHIRIITKLFMKNKLHTTYNSQASLQNMPKFFETEETVQELINLLN